MLLCFRSEHVFLHPGSAHLAALKKLQTAQGIFKDKILATLP